MSKEKGPDNRIIKELILENSMEAAASADGISRILEDFSDDGRLE